MSIKLTDNKVLSVFLFFFDQIQLYLLHTHFYGSWNCHKFADPFCVLGHLVATTTTSPKPRTDRGIPSRDPKALRWSLMFLVTATS